MLDFSNLVVLEVADAIADELHRELCREHCPDCGRDPNDIGPALVQVVCALEGEPALEAKIEAIARRLITPNACG